MPKFYKTQYNLTGGEFSPRLSRRSDFSKYGNGLGTMLNFQTLPHGAATGRAGSHYVAGVKTNSKKVKLIAFEFSVTQAYIIEFGDQYCRFYKDNGQIVSGGSPVEISTPYLEADLFGLQVTQSADTLFIAHKSYAPRKITRTSHTAWTLTTISFTGAVSFPATFCAGAAGVGVDGNNKNPATVCFFEERLLWGGSNNSPQTIWSSQSGSFENMAQGTGLADEGFEYTIASNQVNVIRWMIGEDVLLIGTVGAEFKMTGGSSEAVTPTNVRIIKQTRYGSNVIRPVEAGAAVLYVQRSNQKVREMAYSLTTDKYLSPDMSILAEHITAGGIVDMDYQQEPDSILWCVRADGVLLGMTYERDQEVVAWHRHTLGGTETVVESVAIIPSVDGLNDEVWLSVKRTVNGSTVRYVEYMDKTIHVDSGLKYSGVATTVLTGLTHLVGQTVHIVGDGAVFPEQVVSVAGTVTISKAVATAYIGLGYTPKIITLEPEVQMPDGSSVGRAKQINKITVDLYQSLGLNINGQTVPFRRGSDPMDSEPPVFTGKKSVSNMGSVATITITQPQPLPITILAITAELTITD